MRRHLGPRLAVEFSPHSMLVFRPKGDIAIHGECLENLRGHRFLVVGFVHLGDPLCLSTRLITENSPNHAVKLWDAVLGTETFELRHGEPLAGAAMTRDGFQLIAAGWDGTLTFWDATPIVRDPGKGALRSAE